MAVINESLMDNHQSELGDRLHAEGYILRSSTKKVMQDIDVLFKSNQLGKFKKYPPSKDNVVIDFIDSVLLLA